ncbi:hypothetical protein [Nonomuraea sp. LPB2021202275-12-8]|uniref:hypothetical protein n=1 Tax=Nonomuraea sp. LPB2021202275-12-8 TaxID=3120159 RepID=UPI00300C7682
MTITVVVLVGVGVLVPVVVFVGVLLLVGDPVPVGEPVPTTMFSEGPPDVPGSQLYQSVPFTLSAKPPALTATVPVAVGLITMPMVGIGMGEPSLTAVCGVTVALAVTGVLGTGLPLGVAVPTATTVLLAEITAVASSVAVPVGRMSQFTVTVALATGAATGVFSSI